MIALIKTSVSTIALFLQMSNSMINGVIKTESNFNPKAINKTTKAYGLMQLKPSTEKWVINHKQMGQQFKVLKILSYNPFLEENIQNHLIVASLYLKYLHIKKKNRKRALYAYNCGPNKKYNEHSHYMAKVEMNKEDWYVAKL